MDLHVRSVSPSPRATSSGRAQPIRLHPVRPLVPAAPAPVEDVPVFQPLTRAKSGAFTYEQGGFVLAGQAEADADGQPQVRGTARFQHGKLSLESEGRFVLGYEGAETALIGEGDFVWRDGRGTPLSGNGSVTVRQDALGNAIIQLNGRIASRHQTIEIDGPAQAEVDARADGAFVLRLKGRARFGTPLATIDGDLDLTYGEVDGERLNTVTLQGRAQGQNDIVDAGGEGALTRRWQYGRTGTVLTIAGPGTYRHGNLICQGQIVLRIVPHGHGEAYDGTVLGEGQFRDEGLTAAGRIHGAFFQYGSQHDFDGRLQGELALRAGPASVASPGTLELTLRHDQTQWQASPANTAVWRGRDVEAAVSDSLWKRLADGTTAITGTGDLSADQGPWWWRMQGAVGLIDGPEGWTVSGAGQGHGGLVGGVALDGPAKVTWDSTACLVQLRSAGAASLAGAAIPAKVAVCLESGPLPDGRDFWHARLGSAGRAVRLSAVATAAGPVGRLRSDGGDSPVDLLVPLADLPPPPEPPQEQPDAEAEPERPEAQGHP